MGNNEQSMIQEMVFTLADDSVNGIFVMNESGFIYINEGFATLFGYDRDDILSGMIAMPDLIMDDSLPTFNEKIEKQSIRNFKSTAIL